MFKSKICAVLAGMLLLTSLEGASVYAYELPHSFWSINDGYTAASESKNYDEIINYGTQSINLISKEPENEQTRNIMGSRTYDVAFAYMMKGDYVNAGKYFEMYIPYGKSLGWTDGVMIAEACAKQFKSTIDVYQTVGQSQKTYGIKNEPNGVLYGQVADKSRDGESMSLVYVEYGDTSVFGRTKNMLDNAKKQGKSVELALNFPNEGTTARNINTSDSFIAELHSLLSEYAEVSVYLRIGAEFNVWSYKCTPQEFISAYKAIVQPMRDLKNVSVVWSMAHTSSWKTDTWQYTADDFYPGDEYVDWVGVNCYTSKYFQGRKWDGESQYNEACFKTGYSADPVLMIKDVVEKYGSRKPIMISECGSAYRTNGEINETHSEWAAKYLKQIYSLIPVVYPQVKMIAYFNVKMPNETNYYNLDGDDLLNSTYNNITQSEWFVQNKNDNSASKFFKKLGGNNVTDTSAELYTYPHIYGADTVTVEYYVDDARVATTNEVPYTARLDNLKGTHKLKVVATGNNGVSQSKEYTLVGYAPAENAEDFTDTSYLNNGQKKAINYTIGKNIMTGYEDNSFKPDLTITRGEFAAVVCRMMGYEADEASDFDDTRNHWSSKYVNACVKVGIIHGIGDNKFSPDSNITVEQAVKILTSACGYADENTEYPNGYMQIAREHNLFDNNTTSEIGKNAKRIDVAVMLYNIAER